ncbi:MAG: Uma2 family endonuclease [Clostridiales bacterium]|nr:Uma2 family endonuclease [Clostridiales bacterium]
MEAERQIIEAECFVEAKQQEVCNAESPQPERRPMPGKLYTYADYYAWNDGKRYELIDGAPYLMEPAPLWEHQGVGSQLNRLIGNHLEGTPGKVFQAPFDVRLNADAGDDTVVQPDIVVFCDSSKLSGTGCIGAPDMVVEILSPSTSKRDKEEKFEQYRKAGVREYWIVDRQNETLTAYILRHGEYIGTTYANNDEAPVCVLDGCVIKLADVFR